MKAQIVGDSQATLRQHGRTFWLASHFLAPDRRDDAAVVYAFCRMVDDIADEAEEGGDPATIDADLDAVVEELCDQSAPRPLVAAFADVCERRSIPKSAALELIEGCRSDVHLVRVRTRSEVIRYAYRVAGTVGIMMCGVLDVRNRDTAIAHGIDLGVAMQLTNISRDVLADAEMNRVYVPGLLRSDAAETSALAVLERDPENVHKRTAEILRWAEDYYESAAAGFRYIPLRSRIAIAVAALAYRAIGFVVAARGFRYRAPRAVVSRSRKAICVVRGFLLALAPPAVPAHNSSLHTALAGLSGTNPEVERPGPSHSRAHVLAR